MNFKVDNILNIMIHSYDTILTYLKLEY